MAYLFLSQLHKANAGECSWETYGSKDGGGMRLSANMCQHSLNAHLSIILLIFCQTLLYFVLLL